MHNSIWKRKVDSAPMAGSVRACEGRRCLRTVKAIEMAVLLLSLPMIVTAQQIAIGEYAAPTVHSRPGGIALGQDGALWFTEYGSNKIGRISTAGVITEYPIPTPRGGPSAITGGPDGALWFVEGSLGARTIGRITTAGVITEYPVLTASLLAGIAAGPDGALWFTEEFDNRIGRITTAGVITEYPLPTEYSNPTSITAGPDGALWFIENGKIGRITTAGVITECPLPIADSGANGITTGPDGALWFTESGKIGRITTAGVITEYPMSAADSGNGLITVGPDPDGALWFTENYGNKIGRITTAGIITEYPVPTADSGPGGISLGPDNALWFTEGWGNRIGQAVFVTAGLDVSPPNGVFQTNLTFTGNAFAPYENVQIYLRGVGSAALAGATADGSGSFTATARTPQSPYGHRLFLGLGQSSGKLGATDFSVTPRLILSPNAGTVGSTAVAQGTGFGSLETVKIYWNNPRILLGTATANVNGTFTGSAALTFTIPSGAPLGFNKIFGKGQTTGAIGGGSFTVQ